MAEEGLTVSSDTPVTRRSRRERKRNRRDDALDKIRLFHQTGIRQEDDLESTDSLFDYISEEDYSKLVEERQRNCWILNDDGTYREHGREIFDEEVINMPTNEKQEKRPAHKTAKGNSNIKKMVLGMGGGKKKSNEGGELSVQNDVLLSEMLSQIDNQPQKQTKRFKSFTPRSTDYVQTKPLTPPTSRKPAKPVIQVPQLPIPDPSPSINDNNDIWEPSYDELQHEDTAIAIKKEEVKENKMEEERIIREKRETVPMEAVSMSGWETIKEELNLQAPPPSDDTSALIDSKTLPLMEDEDGNQFIRFYWLDAYEDSFRQPGIVYLFGKIWIEDAHAYISCCIIVRNIERCLYFLPRDKILSKSGTPSDQDVTMQDVYMEFNEKFAEKYRLMKFASKKVTKKYAFELPDVPRESEYLEVRYSADYQAPPSDASGYSFSKVFGTTTSSLERLILSCQIKGPCWLDIKAPSKSSNNVSWCRIECIADGLTAVRVSPEQAPPPPLTVLSLSIKILLNTRTRTNEILCFGALVHQNVSLDKPPPSTPFQNDFCTIRCPPDRHMPARLQEHMDKKGLKLEITSSERGLLAYFLAKLAKTDPDIIIGHNLTTQWLDTLQHRMFSCKVPSWSRIGRLKRQNMPKGRGTAYSLCCGRLVCDVKLSAKELIRSRSYDLSELASSVLKMQYRPMENEDISAAFGSIDSLSLMIKHTMEEAFLSLKLTHELSVLPLAYQITCIAGNTMSRTLLGGRSERNEYLLLHAFTQRGYIPPDKQESARRAQVPTEGDEEGGVNTTSRRHKPAYVGGLVLDPKVGFYDRLILLLDFNSLYPSIIQEYNICFTTIDHAHCISDEDFAALAPPGDTQPQGILPAEIRVLVERRRQVKQLMKGATSKDMIQQYDIRQKALKLTANSMYGCLGFSHSRFHAKPLAALVTSKGRQILEQTRDLATKLGLDVIYGDTDSIMIDSGTKDLKKAESLAHQVKSEVNKLYRLLEIDIDGIFKCMLLLKKKKYAAISIHKHDNELIEKRELKGIDIVRRDWSDLAKRAGHFVLDEILAGQNLDDLIEHVQTFLMQISDEVRSGKTDLKDFIITKALTKLPKDYPDKKSLPHVQVAMRMISRQQHVQPGDVIPYIICEGEGSTSHALRSFHPNEVIQQQLKVDGQYYLQHQVHAVISRLCEPIAGLDASHLAEWLGLDPSAYSNRSKGNEDEIQSGDTLLPEGEVFQADPLYIHCSKCGIVCQHFNEKENYSCTQCGNSFTDDILYNAVLLSVRYYISLYYQGWLICKDPSCQFRTRCSLMTNICPVCGPEKDMGLKEEYSSGDLYCQLRHFKSTFSGKELISKLIQQYLDANAYCNVNLKLLFPTLR